MYFNVEDMIRLRVLDDDQLYILNYQLEQKVSEIKNIPMVRDELVCELVILAETAAHEVARRNHWSPKRTKGRYSRDGITYDTEEYRKWLRGHWNTAISDISFLESFSFWDNLLSLASA